MTVFDIKTGSASSSVVGGFSRRIAMVLLCLSAAMCLPRLAWPQEVSVSTRSQLVQAVEKAQPGATILIAAGSYEGGLHFDNLHGAEGKPIVLAAADKQNPPVFEGHNSSFHFTDPAYVELRDLVLSGARGNGINIDDGGSYDTPAHHVVLRGLTIRDVGPRGNRDGVKLSGLDDFRVENCTIERWGDSGSGIDMVGCHRGTIVGCTFRYRSDIGANGVQTKGGSKDIAIQRCRFENAGSRGVNVGGSTGLQYFRPAPQGYEAKDIVVEDCTFIGAGAPVCYVGVDGAVVRYNTIYRPGRNVLRILQETRGAEFVPSRNGVFANNVIAFRSDEIREIANIGPGTAPETFQFAGNHWFCIDRPERSDRLSLPAEETGGNYGNDPQFVDAAAGNLRLQETNPVKDAGVRPQ